MCGLGRIRPTVKSDHCRKFAGGWEMITMKMQLLATEPRRLMGEDADLIDLLVSELRGGRSPRGRKLKLGTTLTAGSLGCARKSEIASGPAESSIRGSRRSKRASASPVRIRDWHERRPKWRPKRWAAGSSPWVNGPGRKAGGSRRKSTGRRKSGESLSGDQAAGTHGCLSGGVGPAGPQFHPPPDRP